MEVWHFVWLLAAATGLVSAGLVGSLCALVSGERPTLWMLADYRPTLPLSAAALVIYAPMGLVNLGSETLEENPAFAICLLSLGVFWGFMQGVFIMTTFFGFT